MGGIPTFDFTRHVTERARDPAPMWAAAPVTSPCCTLALSNPKDIKWSGSSHLKGPGSRSRVTSQRHVAEEDS